jgi:NADH-quinone oxidoreductase subunit F
MSPPSAAGPASSGGAVDLHLMPAAPTEEERAAVDEVLGPPEPSSDGGGGRVAFLEGRITRGGHEVWERRTMLLPALHALQRRAGWISEGGLNYVCERLTVPPAEAYGVATFYAMFSVEPRPQTVLHLCDDLACRVAGADELIRAVGEELGDDRADQVVRSPCLGLCERAPAALMQMAGEGPGEIGIGSATLEVLDPFLHGGMWTVGSGDGSSSAPQQRGPATRDGLRLLRRVGIGNAYSLDEYRDRDGYAALASAVELGPERVVQEVTDAKLLGRGGAAFPTGVKWKAVADQAITPHFVVANADESEPGTFKDRIVMEHDPFALVEALSIAGFATGSARGYVYVRGEYPFATSMLRNAIDEARAAGLLGDDVMGAGFAFDIELRRGAGAYICGEETALFESIEGNRGEPRNKPPFPVTHGLFGKPTAINNVETLINVLEILRIGAAAYTQIGTADSTGPRLFCLSGHVERPGVYEHHHGVTLRQVLDAAGGMREGRPLRAVLLGGAAGVFVGPDELDIRMTFEDARAGGYTLGSGVVMAFDDTVDLTDICLRIARFFRDESCGQCVPCRVGTVRQDEALHRLASGRPLGSADRELALLTDIGGVMRDASICGLGQTASSAIRSAIDKFGVFAGGRGQTGTGA